jgi:hypothetical protein
MARGEKSIPRRVLQREQDGIRWTDVGGEKGAVEKAV